MSERPPKKMLKTRGNRVIRVAADDEESKTQHADTISI